MCAYLVSAFTSIKFMRIIAFISMLILFSNFFQVNAQIGFKKQDIERLIGENWRGEGLEERERKRGMRDKVEREVREGGRE